MSQDTIAEPPQVLSSFEEFKAMDLSELRTLQAKLTYIGTQTKPIPTVAFTSYFHVLDMDRFKPFRLAGVHYGNDELPIILNFTVTPQELEKMIMASSNIPTVKKGQRNGDFLSFMMYNEVDGDKKGFEAILNHDEAKILIEAIMNQLKPESGLARQILENHKELLF